MSKLSIYAEEIKKLVPMREAMELYGFSVGSKGVMVCPFHSEKTGSFKVYPDHFYCFGCGASGDVVAFVQKYFNVGFLDAIKKVNNDFGLGLPIGERMTLSQAREYKEKERKKEEARKNKEDREEALQREYRLLVFEEKRLRKNITRYKPKDPYEELQPLFVEACQRLDYISYTIDTFNFEKGGSAQ